MKRLALLAIAITAAIAAESAGDRWWKHVAKLAGDEFEGRDTGSPGHRKAAEYVAGEFERAGLKAAGTGGYFQPVKFRSRTIQEEKCSLALVRDGKAEPLTLGEDAKIELRGDPAPQVEADSVFVGYGLRIPEHKHDDLAGLDLKGKVAVVFTSAPSFLSSALAAHLQNERWKRLREAGAIGIATIADPKHMDVPWERLKLARFVPALQLAEPAMNENAAGQRLRITINPAHADKWLAGSGHTSREIFDLAEKNQPIPRFPLRVKVRARVSWADAALTSDNVVAMLPGGDQKLRSEYVVLSAHLDGYGVGRPIREDKIYNGAMDNATGVATLIELARQLAAQPPKRSILFVVVTGEERGLLGSRFYARKPTVPAAQIVANLNVDMFLPLFPLKSVVVYGLEESDLGDASREVGRRLGLGIVADREPKRNIFTRSDQYNFIRAGVPALLFKFDAEPGSREDRMMKQWLTERYHAPSDDALQPVDREAAARFNGFILELTKQVANTPERPRWKPASFFRRFAKSAS